MKPDPNKNATKIMSAQEKPQEESGVMQELDATDLAAEEILAAIASGDSKALSEALRAHYEMCEASKDAE